MTSLNTNLLLFIFVIVPLFCIVSIIILFFINKIRAEKFLKKYPLYHSLLIKVHNAKIEEDKRLKELRAEKAIIDQLFKILKYYNREDRRVIIKRIKNSRIILKNKEEKYEASRLIVSNALKELNDYKKDNNINEIPKF